MTRVEVVTAVTDEVTATVWPLYESVFGDQDDEEAWRANVWDRHAGRAGFRLAMARDDAGRPAGFAYGYTGERGQWWTDRASEALAPEVADAWLGGHFELVSIGVLPRARGRGVGGALLAALTADLPHDRWLLMTTADPHDPARRLYASRGWEVLGPGVGADKVVMGRRNSRAKRATSR